MYFLVEDDELLEKYTVWDKVSANIKNEFDSEPVYNKKILKTNTKFHGDEVGDFYDKKNSKVHSNHACSAWVLLPETMRVIICYYLRVISLMKNKFGWSKPFIFERKGDKKS